MLPYKGHRALATKNNAVAFVQLISKFAFLGVNCKRVSIFSSDQITLCEGYVEVLDTS